MYVYKVLSVEIFLILDLNNNNLYDTGKENI